VHAIAASEIGATLEIERVNPEGQENTQESEAQPAGPKEPEEEVECLSHEPHVVRERQALEHYKPPILFKQA